MKVEAARERWRRPKWLPEGWAVKVGAGEKGKTAKYYTSESGRTFYSKQEVLHYLKTAKFDGHASETPSENKEIVVPEVRNSPEWLPRGWILEIKTRSSRREAGKNYKCYFDPASGARFYSKEDVLQFIESGNAHSPTSKEKRLLKASTSDNVIAQIEYSPEGLPDGWIKELLFRKSNKGVPPKRDPYYTDPVTGCVFRSLREATHYVKTGELGKHVIAPRKRSINEMYSLGKESPPPIPAQDLKSANLSSELASTSKRDGPRETNKLPELQTSHNALSDGLQKADAVKTPDIEETAKKTDKKRSRLNTTAQGSSHNSRHAEKKAKTLRDKQASEATAKVTPAAQARTQQRKKDKSASLPVAQARTQQRKKDKSASLPRRSSRRLAGLEAAAAASELVVHPSSCQPLSNGPRDEIEEAMLATETEKTASVEKLPAPNNSCNGIEKSKETQYMSIITEEPERMASGSEAPEMMQEAGAALLTEPSENPDRKASDDGPSSQFALPFGNAWSDPCIEFAVKTLMGEIPVFDEEIAIEEFLQKQLSSVGTSTNANNLSASINQGLDPGEQHLPADERPPPPRSNGPKVKG